MEELADLPGFVQTFLFLKTAFCFFSSLLFSSSVSLYYMIAIALKSAILQITMCCELSRV